MFAVVTPVNTLTEYQDINLGSGIQSRWSQCRRGKANSVAALQYSISLEGLPVPTANEFILLSSKSPFLDNADIGQKDNFALNYLESKVKGN